MENNKANRKKFFLVGLNEGSDQKVHFGSGVKDEPFWAIDAYRRGWMQARSKRRPFGRHPIYAEHTVQSTKRPHMLRFYYQLTKAQKLALIDPNEETNSYLVSHGVPYDLSNFYQIIPVEHIGKMRYPATAYLDTRGDLDDWDCRLALTDKTGIVVRYRRDEHGDFDPEQVVIGTYTINK